MIRIGLTGSIGMGKSTTARMFAEQGVPVYDADASVHRLYEGAAVPLVEAQFPGTTADGKVDRKLLSEYVVGKPNEMKKLEAIIHPLVKQEENAFLANARKAERSAVVLDIPLLIESGALNRVDLIVVVTADPDIQKRRVMDRPGMTDQTFRAILSKQMPDAEKRRRAHFIIDTGLGIDAAQRAVKSILRAIAGR
ncbi:dephospho-CoA kinase [Roseibium hamelinense]|uniref:Dephospho-CoA kinase n=1 Tax=Roseibium hamelinense TaxID=150831 RepID=A0A562SNE9_9HYPH|nr:dephospho-CoA kinase [Roseibium hamelinense]MTI44399.1 dephospho-CoA kinase [Roseibium hamelinense]TWI82825.1 dephospho-CoA kinase [Roseibium hamelinense]